MTREIKFRAWDKKNKKMIPDVHNTYDDYETDDSFGDLLKNGGYEVMQYTGLKDKNGKEIWEGDIVKAYTYFDEDHKELCDATIHEIKWGGDYPAFELYPHAGYEESNCLQMFASIQPEGEQIEVIGNIYETPELLK